MITITCFNNSVKSINITKSTENKSDLEAYRWTRRRKRWQAGRWIWTATVHGSSAWWRPPDCRRPCRRRISPPTDCWMTMTKAYLLRPHSHNSDTFGASFMWHTGIFSAFTVLVGRQKGHPACKNWVVGCWRGYLSGARCRLAYGPANFNWDDASRGPSAIAELLVPFWYRLTQVVLEKRPLNRCSSIVVTKRRQWLGEEMHGLWSRGSKTKRKTKEDLERGCQRVLSSM